MTAPATRTTRPLQPGRPPLRLVVVPTPQPPSPTSGSRSACCFPACPPPLPAGPASAARAGRLSRRLRTDLVAARRPARRAGLRPAPDHADARGDGRAASPRAAAADDLGGRLRRPLRRTATAVVCRGTAPLVVGSVHVCEPLDGVAEISAVARRAGRAHAVAARLEGIDGRWRCAALQIG